MQLRSSKSRVADESAPVLSSLFPVCVCFQCGEFDNAGAMMSVDETLMCSFQILKPAEKKAGGAAGGPGAKAPGK